MNQPVTRKRNSRSLNLSQLEVLHLRDILSVSLPGHEGHTVSQALATAEGRSLVEEGLWKKVVRACESFGLPTGDHAPDFVVSVTASPPMGVFRLAEDVQDDRSEEQPTRSGPFGEEA